MLLAPLSRRAGAVSAAVAAAIVLAASPSAAQKKQASASDDKFMQELSSYRLTDAALAKFTQAAQNLIQLQKDHPELAKEAENEPSSGDVKSIDEMVALYHRHPQIERAINSASMSTRDFVLFSMSMFQAGMGAWALQQSGKLPEGTPMANVTFYKAHEAQLKKLNEEMQAAQEEGKDSSGSSGAAGSDSTGTPSLRR